MRDADRTAPYFGIVDDKSGDEVLIFPGRHPVLQMDANDLVAGSLGAVPGAVFGCKTIAAIFRGEVAARVERQAERCRMRLKQYIGYRDLVLQIGPLALVPRVFVAADIKPRPSIECIFADTAHEVGHQIITEAVALIGGAPRRAALRLDREADAIADSSGEYFL